MFLLNTNNYFRVRVRVRFRVRFRVRVSVLLNTFTPQFSVGEPVVRINSDILVSAKLQLYRMVFRHFAQIIVCIEPLIYVYLTGYFHGILHGYFVLFHT